MRTTVTAVTALTAAFILSASPTRASAYLAQPDHIPSGTDTSAETTTGSCGPVSPLLTIGFIQQRSGDGTGEGSSRSDACGNAQRDASDAGERACDGPFDVDACRCDRDERDPDDPDDDLWDCTARWRCEA